MSKWYKANNEIEKICNGSGEISPIRYKYLKIIFSNRYKRINTLFHLFFKELYSEKFLSLKCISDKVGNISDHYKTFFKTNDKCKCPFCGISDLHGIHHTKREAYDHYLPKGTYPFNSINFRNLAPTCHHCNSSYKHTKDPVRSKIGNRKAFYPYSTSSYAIEITISLSKTDIDHLAPNDIQLAFGPTALNEEIDTWKEVYGIEERYRAKLLDGDGKAWLVEVLDEWKWKEESAGAEGRAPDQYLRGLKRHTVKSPFNSCNFLKEAFLEGCERAGVFMR